MWDCTAAHRFRQAGMIMRVILFWLGTVFVMHGLCTLGYLLFWNELAAGHEVSLAMVHPLQVVEAVIDVWNDDVRPLRAAGAIMYAMRSVRSFYHTY